METLIIGAGAMGCVFGAALQEGFHSVTFYDTDQNKVDIMQRNGITITGLNETQKSYKVNAISQIDEAPLPDLVLVMVKSYSTSQAARELRTIILPATMVLPLQNGLGHIARMAKYLDEKQIFPGVTYQAAFETAPGQVKHNNNGLTTLAPMVKSSLSQAMDLARLLNNSHIPAAASTDVKPLRWKKLIINSVINPLSAIHKLLNGDLPKNPQIVHDMMGLVTEGVAVAQKVGVPLNYGEMWVSVLEGCRATAHNRSSMLLDIENGRVTEIEAINGSIVRLGEQYGINTPFNNSMVRKIVALHGKSDRMRLDQ